MKVFSSEKVPIRSWCENPEDSCIAQAKNLANLPFVFKHVALMPDTHMGYGMPIGGVLATRGVVIPNAVGVDIGCGMRAVRTSWEHVSVEGLKEIMGYIRKTVPLGFKHHDKPLVAYLQYDCTSVVEQLLPDALAQVGTLGGGNHFIEIQKGSDGYIWCMIHSGSRNLGYKVARHYNDLAVSLNKSWFCEVPLHHELAFLPVESDGGRAYIKDMNACLNFARFNREIIAMLIKEAFDQIGPIKFAEDIDIHHNYAALERHFGENVWVHRKGATSAKLGEIGLIPGSQGTSSHVVEGLGNRESFMSCSHGAGRKMGRKEAQRSLNLEEQKKLLNDRGIVHSIRNAADLDEAPGAYKDIDTVMSEQTDLVKSIVRLEPLAVVKG